MEIKQTIEIKFSCQNCSLESLDPGNVLVSRLLKKLETTKDFSLGEEAAVLSTRHKRPPQDANATAAKKY